MAKARGGPAAVMLEGSGESVMLSSPPDPLARHHRRIADLQLGEIGSPPGSISTGASDRP